MGRWYRSRVRALRPRRIALGAVRHFFVVGVVVVIAVVIVITVNKVVMIKIVIMNMIVVGAGRQASF